MRHQAEFLPTVLLLVWLWFHRVARTYFSSCDFNLDGVILERGCMLGVDLRFNIHLTELSYRRLSKHVRLSDLSLGTRPRYSLVVDEDVKKPTNHQPTNQTKYVCQKRTISYVLPDGHFFTIFFCYVYFH